MNKKIAYYVMSMILLLNVLPFTSITVNAEELSVIGYIKVISDTDNTARKIKVLDNEGTIFASAEDISLITGYDLEVGELINYSKVGDMDTVTAVDIEFDGAVSAMGRKYEIHIVNNEDEIYLPLSQMLYLLHSQWWISEDKLVIRALPYTIIDFLGSENYESMWENKVNQTDLLMNGECELMHAFRTSLAAVFNDFDPQIFVLWWPGEGLYPFINEEYEEALLQIAIDDMDFLNTYDQESIISVFEESGFSNVKSNWDNAKSIIDIPDNIAEGAHDIDKIVESLSKNKDLKYFIYDFETLDPAILKAMSEKMDNVSNVMDITSIILDVAEISQRSHNWGEQYINQIRVLTDFDDSGYNKSVANNVKTVANGLIKEYQDPIQAAADEAALQATSLFLSKLLDESVIGKYFAVLTAGISIAKTYDNVRNDMEAADLAYMVDCLVKIEQIAMKEMSQSYSKLLSNNITGDFSQADLERLRNCTMLSLRTNLRNRAFIYYLNLKLNDDNNWENSIYAKNIQQQIVDDYAKICLLMETEKYDSLLFLDDFKNMYSNEYGSIREQLTLDIFHEGEIVEDAINFSDKEWNEYLSLFLCTHLTDYSGQEQDFSKLMWFAYWYIEWNDFNKITYDNEYAIISEVDINKVLEHYFDKISPHNSIDNILYNDGMFYYPSTDYGEIGRQIAIVNKIELINNGYKIYFDTAYIYPENVDTGELNPIEDWDEYYGYSLEQIKTNKFCEMRGVGEAVLEMNNNRAIMKRIIAYNNIIRDGDYVSLTGTIQTLYGNKVLILEHPYFFYRDGLSEGEEIEGVGLTGNTTNVDLNSIDGKRVSIFGEAVYAHTGHYYYPVSISNGWNNLKILDESINLEEEIENIKSVYNDIQDNSSALYEVDGGGGTTRYYDPNNRIRKIVCIPDCYQEILLNYPELAGYSAEYYYDKNEQLKFVFIYNEYGDEHRFYIYDRSYCIRYIDGEGNIYDFPDLTTPIEVNTLGVFCSQAQLEIAWAYGG